MPSSDLLRQSAPRIVGVVNGDIVDEPASRTKYGPFFAAVGRRFPLVGVYDAQLHGLHRLLNALLVFHPDRRIWRQRFHHNLPAFRTRSAQVAAHLERIRGQADVVLQVNALFDARWRATPLPSVIYTDYTTRLAARRPAARRTPFRPQQLARLVALEQQTFAHADQICTRSQIARRSIVGEYGIAADRVTAIGGGVNFDPLPPLPLRPERDAPTALLIGSSLYRKGGDLLLHAFAQARREVPAARLILLLRDPIPPELPLENVTVLTPTWDRAEIARLYEQADLFVLPSRLETWGDVLLEAMSYGLPCVGVAGEAMEEIIVDGVTGLIVPPENVAALAAALVRLFREPQTRRQWGLAARQRVETEFTWDRVVERLTPAIYAAARHPLADRALSALTTS